MNYHIFNRVYENIVTGKQSELYAEACCGLDAVTLASNFICPSRGGGFWKTDPFVEVRTANPETLDRLRGVNPRSGGLDDLIDAICSAIVAIWDPNKMHVVFHSSGHDSRMLSSCIRKVYRERGPDWLGGLLFLSNRWEAKIFYEIMRLQGWNRNQYAVYEDGPAIDHYGRVLDFERYWYTTNAPCPQLGAVLSYLTEWAQEKGLLPEDECLQMFNGHGPEIGGNREGAWTLRSGANATGKAIWKNSLRYYYWAGWLNQPSNPHTNFVLAEEGVINAALGFDFNGSKRQALANQLCPEIKHLPRMAISDGNHPVSDEIRHRAEQDYASSYYAKLTGTKWVAPVRSSDGGTRWATWGLASLVEHLHQQGIEIVQQ